MTDTCATQCEQEEQAKADRRYAAWVKAQAAAVELHAWEWRELERDAHASFVGA